jgi:hypothetical protein
MWSRGIDEILPDDKIYNEGKYPLKYHMEVEDENLHTYFDGGRVSGASREGIMPLK